MKRNDFCKKVVSLLACGCIMAGCLTGCGDTNTESKAPSESKSTVESTASTSGSVVEQSSEEVVEEPAELTMWSMIKTDSVYYEKIQEACNVKLKFVDSTGGKETMSILIGTNDLPDLVLCSKNDISGGVQNLLDTGVIVPLNDLMAEGWMPNFEALMETDTEMATLLKNDEGKYAWATMMYAEDAPTSFQGYMIRKDWLDELNLEVPTSIEAMEKVLLAFKEKKGVESGLAFSWKTTSIFPQSWGVVEDFYVDNGEIKYGYMEDSYKEYLARANEWINLGILDPDTFSQDQDTFWAKMAMGKTGLVFGFTGGEFNKILTMKEENPDMEWIPIPWPGVEDGEGFPVDNGSSRLVDTYGIFVSSKCENKEAAARVIDYIYSEEGTMLSNYGVEGISYEMVNGQPVLTELITNNPEGKGLTDALALYAGPVNKPYINTKMGKMLQYAQEVQQDSLEIWDTSGGAVTILPPLSMTADEKEEYNLIMTDIKTYVAEYKLKFILGSESLDNFKTFKNNLINMKIERAIEITQGAYDRFMSR